MIKKITVLILLLSTITYAQKRDKQRWSDTYVVKEKPRIPQSEIEAFVGKDQYVITYAAGDFNGDERIDAIVVLGDKKEIEKHKESQAQIKRPLLILKRNEDGILEKMHENDKIVYCYMCDAPHGSPLTSILFTGNTFAVQHEAGKANRWTRIITFEYDKERGLWFLIKDAVSRYNIMNSKGFEAVVKTQNDFGFITFDRVDVYEEDLIKKKS